MKHLLFSSLLLFSLSALAEVKPKSDPPNFKLNDLEGKEHALNDFKGKWVVLEWFNKDCPYVKKHYGSKNLSLIHI